MFSGFGRQCHAVRMVDAFCDCLELVLNRQIEIIREMKFRRLFTEPDDLFRKRLAAFATLRIDFRKDCLDAGFGTFFLKEGKFFRRIGREGVDRDT